MFLQVCVILFTGEGVPDQVHPPGPGGGTWSGGVPGLGGCTWSQGVPGPGGGCTRSQHPQTRYTPRPGTPWDRVHPPPGPGTP